MNGIARISVAGAGLVALALFSAPAAAQSFGVTPRFGKGMTQDITELTATTGLEARLHIRPDMAVIARGDMYEFAFACIGLDTCPNEATAVAVGAQYRPESFGPASFFVGGDVGRTWWSGGVRGWVARPRTGVDVRLVGPLNASMEFGYTRFIHSALTEGWGPPVDFVGLSGGLSLRFQ